MNLALCWVTIDTTAPQRLAPFWEELLGWRRLPDLDHEGAVGLVPADEAADGDDGVPHAADQPWTPGAGGGPGLLLFHSSDPTPGKNRVHLDLLPAAGGVAERDAAVERACALGATRVQVGQRGDEPWVVLADPEGNEFCILGSPTG
jgi:predicted enzyme related to lactoylglutathione lyase